MLLVESLGPGLNHSGSLILRPVQQMDSKIIIETCKSTIGYLVPIRWMKPQSKFNHPMWEVKILKRARAPDGVFVLRFSLLAPRMKFI